MRMVPAVTCDPFKMADMAAARNQKEKNETREEHVGKTGNKTGNGWLGREHVVGSDSSPQSGTAVTGGDGGGEVADIGRHWGHL